MSDSAAANGTRARTGYFSSLATDVFGRYAFDDGNWRFLTFLSQQRTAQLPTARDFSSAWTGLRAANLSGVGGPLTALTVDVGTWLNGGVAASDRARTKLQRAITQQLEERDRRRLHEDMMRLPVGDPRRDAWLSEDNQSSQFLTSHPTRTFELGVEEFRLKFREAFCTYLGAESPATRGLGALTIPCGGNSRRRDGPRQNDPHGQQINLANLPGASYTICHDAIAHEIWAIVREAGLAIGVEPRHLFHTLIPPAVLYQPGGKPGIVPDATRTRPSTSRCRAR